jgi:hypothetical protein
VLTFTGSTIKFGTVELANNLGLGPSFTVAGLNPGTVLQATQPNVAGFSAVTFPLAASAGDVLVGIGTNAIGSLPVGSTGQILSVVAANPIWVDADTVAVTSVVGTIDEIDVVTVDGVATVSVDSAYAGQTSITTLGTVATGTWAGTAVAIAHGGTGQITANAALNALLPSQSGVTSGWVLSTDGTDTAWAAPGGGGSSVAGNMVLGPAPLTSSNPDWSNFSFLITIPANVLLSFATTWTFCIHILSGSLQISSANVRRTLKGSTTYLDSTSVTWSGSSTPTLTAGRTFCDAISVATDGLHDYYIEMYLATTADNTAVTLAENTAYLGAFPSYNVTYKTGNETGGTTVPSGFANTGVVAIDAIQRLT